MALVGEPSLNHVRREDVARQQPTVVLIQSIQHLAERAWGAFDLGGLFRLQFVEILINGMTRINFVLDAVQTRHQLSRETEVRIGGGIGAAEFDALGF